jgi:hypothetical protein
MQYNHTITITTISTPTFVERVILILELPDEL